MIRSLLPALVLVAAGCNGQGEPPPLESSDIRIDQASEDNDPESHSTRMCVNDDGVVYVIWIDDRDGKADIWMNRSDDLGRSWLPSAVKVNDPEAGDIVNPQIACTLDTTYVVWEDDRDGELENHNVYLSWSTTQGELWEPDIRLDEDEDGLSMSNGPQIVAINSDVYVAWYDDLNGSFDVLVNRSRDNGRTWFNRPTRVDSDEPGVAFSARPKIGATADGEVYVSWEDTRHGKSDIYFSRSLDAGGSFGGDIRLDEGDADGQYSSFEPQMSTDDDDIYVVWHDARNGEGNDIFMNYSGDGGQTWLSFAERVESDQPGVFDSRFPAVITDGEDGHIVWQNAATQEGGYDIFYRRAEGGKLQEEEIRLDKDPEGFANSLNSRIAMAGDTLVSAWQDGRDDANQEGYNDLYYNFSTDKGDLWNEVDLRIDAMEPGRAFKVDVSISVFEDEVLASWTDGRNGTGDVFFHHLEVGEEASYEAAGEDTGL